MGLLTGLLGDAGGGLIKGVADAAPCWATYNGTPCDRPAAKGRKGLCQAHYHQQHRGIPFREPRRNYFGDSLEDAIRWAVGKAERQSGCLVLSDCYAIDGYPVKRFRGKQRKIGHLMLEWETGYSRAEAAKAGMEMCHSRDCISRACIHPMHLRWDTRSENLRDVWSKKHLLGPRQVAIARELDEMGCKHVDIARCFGVGQSVVSRAILREEEV